MKTYSIKLKHILPTYCIIAVTTVLALALFRLLFAIQWELIDIKEQMWEMWIPMGLPWIPITIWLRKKLRILTFKDNDRGRVFFQFLCWLTTMAMGMSFQTYLSTTSGKLERLDSIEEITQREKARYYQLAHYRVSRYYNGAHTEFRTSGKYNQDLNMTVYFVAPILPQNSGTIPGLHRYWYGVSYTKQISNKISTEEKEQQYEAFYAECEKRWELHNFRNLDHFERTPTSDDRDNFLKAVGAVTKAPTDNSYIILEPRLESYADRNGSKLPWTFGFLGIGIGALLLAFLWPGLNPNEYKRQLAGKPSRHKDDLLEMLNYLVPKDNHFATSIILNLNLLVFLAMLFSGVHLLSPNGLELLEWGGNRRLETTGGEWWRLVTSMFVHGGIMHLILNICGLVIAALFIEPLLGRKRFFMLYFTSGVLASLISIAWYEHTVSVGASGAIFGLYGAILGLLLIKAFPQETRKSVFLFIGLYVLVNLLWGLTGGVDNAAHMGGLISGALIGVLLYKFGNIIDKEG